MTNTTQAKPAHLMRPSYYCVHAMHMPSLMLLADINSRRVWKMYLKVLYAGCLFFMQPAQHLPLHFLQRQNYVLTWQLQSETADTGPGAEALQDMQFIASTPCVLLCL